MASEQIDIERLWQARNAAAEALALNEDLMRRAVRGATREELVGLIESYSPARSAGPEWTRTFEPLVERLWAWLDDATMAGLAETFRARGPAWAGVANALGPEHGKTVRAALRQPSWARMPAFGVV